MLEKYHSTPTQSHGSENTPHIVTNDLYLAAFLMSQGCEMCGMIRSKRRRLSFVFDGPRVRVLRTEYESGTVCLNVRSFKDNLLSVRRRMDAEQRSYAHGAIEPLAITA